MTTERTGTHDQVELHFMNVTDWSQLDNGYAKGSAFVNDDLLPSTKLSQLFNAEKSFTGFTELLRRLNGFFAGIRVERNSVFLAVDHVRSLPLFYAFVNKRIFVSDDAYWLREQMSDETVHELSAAELLLTRIVSGSETLSPSVKQVQPGEAVALTVTSHGVRKESYRFYEIALAKPTEQEMTQLTNSSDAHLTAAFKRLAEYAAGSTIVVPLGGGLDSRLVVLMLKRIGYDNIISFTYGRPGNRESKISKKVALALKIPWHFIPYSNQDWKRWYATTEWTHYSRFASNLSTTPHLQDWPAVWELKKRRLIPDDAVFVPGHRPSRLLSNALNGISRRLPVEWLERQRQISDDDLASMICETYCILQNWAGRSAEIRHELSMKVKSVLQLPSVVTSEQAFAYFDRWSWENAFAKFMVNSVRVYEFWGYRWWLPLWDLEFIRFWRSLPSHLRFEKRFENAYVRKLETKTIGKPAIPDTSTRNFGPTLVTILNRVRLRNVARIIRARSEYRRHHFAWYGIIDEADYHRAFHGQEDINTYLARETVKQAFPKWKIPQDLDFMTISGK